MEVRQLLILSAAMLAMAGGSGFGQGSKEPYVRVAEIEIDAAQLEAYQAAVKEQIEAAVRLEEGVLALYSVADKENLSHITVLLSCHSRSTLTCCGMRLATPWQAVESIQGRCRPSWGTARSRIPSYTRRWLTSGSETSGASEQVALPWLILLPVAIKTFWS